MSLQHLLLLSLFLYQIHQNHMVNASAEEEEGSEEEEEGGLDSPVDRIYDTIFEHYHTNLIPTKTPSEPKVVQLSMTVYQILEVSSKESYMLIYVWMEQKWSDDFLYWDPAEYDNETEINVGNDEVWRPDTFLYNLLIDDSAGEIDMPVIITPDTSRNTSIISSLYPAVYKFTCVMDPTWFPWDEQVCTLRFGSWTLKFKPIPLKFVAVDEDYPCTMKKVQGTAKQENQMWAVEDTFVKEFFETINGRNASLVEFTFVLHRMPWYFIFNLIVPTVVITEIVFIGIFSPTSSSHERGEKIGIGITGVLALAVILLVLEEELPKTALTTPFISWYCLIMIILIGLALLASITILYIQRKGEHNPNPPPRWLMKLFCLKPNQQNTTDPHPVEVEKNGVENHYKSKETIEYSSGIPKVDPRMAALHVELHTMRKMLAKSLKKVDDSLDDSSTSCLSDWDRLANRVEIVSLIVFTLISIIYTVLFITVGYEQMKG